MNKPCLYFLQEGNDWRDLYGSFDWDIGQMKKHGLLSCEEAEIARAVIDKIKEIYWKEEQC